MAISCICHYRPAHKLVTAHLECRACPLFSFSLCPPPPIVLSSLLHFLSLIFVIFLAPSLSLSFSFLASPPFVYHLFERSLFVSLSFSSSFPLFLHPTKYLPLSRLHSGGEASIVIVPHQRRSAINLSPCRAESERDAVSLSLSSRKNGPHSEYRSRDKFMSTDNRLTDY